MKNIILIVTHDLGQHLGAYGVETVQTPNIDRMASEGAIFKNSFCTSPACSPSRASIFTGRYPHNTGVLGLTHDDFLWRLYQDETHMAAYLANMGYETCLLGNWHENNRIDNVGYQKTVQRVDGAPVLTNEVAANMSHPAAADLAERADYYISQPKEKPFFLYAGFFEPHRPFSFEGCKPDSTKGCWIPPYIPQETSKQREAAEEEFSAMQGCIQRMDQAVGVILDSLDSSGIKDNTLLLFTSDHGIAMPRAKCSLYDPGIQVPLIFRGGGIPEGVCYDPIVSNIDYFPTLLDWADLPLPSNLHGSSLLPCLQGAEYTTRKAVFSEKTYHRSYDPMRCIRTERYKYIINFEFNVAYDAPTDVQEGAIYRTSIEQYTTLRPRYELYDLKADPWEQHNLAGKPEMAEVETSLKSQLTQWMTETEDPVLNGPVPSLYANAILETL